LYNDDKPTSAIFLTKTKTKIIAFRSVSMKTKNLEL